MGWTTGEDIFGDVDGLIREQRGWLTEEVTHECLTLLPSFPFTLPVEGQGFQGKQGRIWTLHSVVEKQLEHWTSMEPSCIFKVH